MANRFLNNITINDEYTLPSADGTADQIITTDGAGQLSFVDQSTINAGNAEHVVIYAKNTSGVSISKGTPVYITGTVGATDTVQIAPADASDSAKMPAVGLLDDTLANNAFGYVITGGFMDNITTDPIDGATPSSNDTVYVKAGGGLTLTKPTGASNLIQNIAKVGKVSGGNSGSLIVSSILRTNDVPNLSTGKIWVGDGNTTESTVVHLDETNGRMGINTNSPSAPLEISTSGTGDSVLITNDDATSSAAPVITLKRDSATPADGDYLGQLKFKGENSTGGEIVYAKITAKTSDVTAGTEDGLIETAIHTNSSNLIVSRQTGTDLKLINGIGLQVDGDVGIGTTSPSYKLDVVGSAQITGSLYLGDYMYHDGDTNTYVGFPSNDTITLRTAGSDRILVTSTGYVGINETSPNARLQVKESSITTFTGTGSSAQLRLRGGYTSNEYIILGFSQDSNKDIGRMAVKRGGSGSSFHWGVSTNYGNGITNEAMILNHQGRLGINNLTPSYLLDVGGDGRVNGTLTCVTLVQTSQRDQKKDIADIDKRKAKAIPFKEYKYKSSIDGSERKRYGVVAEDIENDYPELVHTGADGVKGINYIDLLVKRVAELEKELEDISLTPGPKGDKGDAGAQGPAGANGKNGANGNSHLSNVSSIALNEKTGQLEVTIGKTTLRFNPAK